MSSSNPAVLLRALRARKQKQAAADAVEHLNEVLKATEEATLAILDAAAALAVIDTSPYAREQIDAQLERINSACGFQDISGQRIKKVLKYLQNIGISRPMPETDPLLNGPQFSGLVPSQSEIDKLFGAS